MTRVVFLLVPQLHLLDLAGPAQVFSSAADLGLDYRLHYVAEREQVTTVQGVPLVADTRWPELAPDDLVIVPGWRPTAHGPQGPVSPGDLRRLAEHHRAGGTVASICAGAYALGRAGLLDGRRCTTHHEVQDDLARRHPAAQVIRDVLYVVDDRVVTSAGIASGIDVALHLVATRHGPSTAAKIARTLVVYVRRNGHEQQASAMMRHRSHLSDSVHRVQDLIDSRYAETLPLAELAAAGGLAERTLTRLFRAATGLTPLGYQQVLRVERAEHLIGHGTTVDAAARTVGFSDARMLRRLRARATSSAPAPSGSSRPESGTPPATSRAA
ncbi:AraC family transcriptional regulator with amidase-like domain [Micromonospora sp. A202]|uniref:GlxA family transcriptional regulator n=1 Tax=Micromonospora sp. A202 TaxID=2572899 RepID=UPI00115121EE|nr:AraC family transcriptional regulator [Micromonospora sp. A202]TQJ24686.1 AraC family transcriptional regulator with amidase-like domain [Micromonospora sp. A202]